MTPRLSPAGGVPARSTTPTRETPTVLELPVDGDGVDAVLSALRAGGGASALQWATDPLEDLATVIHLRPGRRSGDVLTVTRGATGPAQVIARGAALPVVTKGVDGVAMLLTLHLLPDLDAAFAEIRRVLRPAGTVVVVVPSVSMRSLAELRHRRLLAPVRRGPWPHRSALDSAGWLLHAADFAVIGDDRVPFTLPIPDAAAARRAVTELPDAGLWPPALSVDVRERLAVELAGHAGPGRVLPVALRRLVARR